MMMQLCMLMVPLSLSLSREGREEVGVATRRELNKDEPHNA
jgi:hypothetical protein